MRRIPWRSLLIGIISAGIALAVTPARSTETPIGRLEVAFRPGPGRTHLEIPPLGSVTANTHHAPLGVHIGLGRLELANLPTTPEAGNAWLEEVRDDLVRALTEQALMTIAVAAALAWLMNRHRARPRGAPIVAVVSLLLVGSGTVIGWEQQRFASPTFHGPLQQAPEVMRRIDAAISGAGQLNRRLDRIVANLQTLTDPGISAEDTTTILHVSDLHSNPVGVTWVNELAERFEVDAVVDTGDITSFGQKLETGAITGPLAVPAERYYAVYGNHDSDPNRARLSERMTPLHETVVDVAGLRFLGQDDPTYTVQEGSGTPQEKAEYAAAGRKLKALCRQERPDVVAVHNPALAEQVAGCAPVLLGGHLHRPGQYRIQGTLVLVAGTSGAGGVEGLEPGAKYYAQLLRFTGGKLYAVDLLEMEPDSGEFTMTRISPEVIRTRNNRGS